MSSSARSAEALTGAWSRSTGSGICTTRWCTSERRGSDDQRRRWRGVRRRRHRFVRRRPGAATGRAGRRASPQPSRPLPHGCHRAGAVAGRGDRRECGRRRQSVGPPWRRRRDERSGAIDDDDRGDRGDRPNRTPNCPGPISGDDLRSPGEATTEFDDEATEDTTLDEFEDFDEFDDYSLDDFDLGEYEDEFDDFTDEDDDFSGSGGGRYLPRRVPYVPSTRRTPSTLPPWYQPTTPTTDPDDTEPDDETTTSVGDDGRDHRRHDCPDDSCNDGADNGSDDCPDDAPPPQGPPWEQATCASGLGLWGTASGQLVSVPGVGVWTFADVAGPFTAITGEVGAGPHRTFAGDPFDGTRGWLVDSAGVLRQLAGGAVHACQWRAGGRSLLERARGERWGGPDHAGRRWATGHPQATRLRFELVGGRPGTSERQRRDSTRAARRRRDRCS